MKGYRTIVVGLLMAIAPSALEYLLHVNWDAAVGPKGAFAIAGVLTIAMRLVTNTSVGSNIAKLAVAGIALALMLGGNAHAADVNKAPAKLFSDGYPYKACGMYYGLNTMGAASNVNSPSAPTATAIQGDIGVTLGYACPIGQAGFWFVEGMFDWANLNGNQAGLSLSGPLHFEQRFGFGGPINTLLSAFPTFSNLGGLLPTWQLPAGVTAGPQHPYIYVGLNEQDVSAQFGAMTNRDWMVSPEVGIGMLSVLSNNVAADVWAGIQMSSKAYCIGGASCAGIVDTYRVGFSLKY